MMVWTFKYSLLLSAVLIVYTGLDAQQKRVPDSVLHEIQEVQLMDDSADDLGLGDRYYLFVDADGDTVVLAGIPEVPISAPRKFASSEEYLRFLKYKKYAAFVYPYAKEAVRIFREAEYVTKNMKKRKRKKYLKKLADDLEREFEEPLGKMSKTQGKILVKMIERELEKPMFDLIKGTRGKWKAFYWNQFSKLYGYRLKDGYRKGDNPILDIVLQDFDISYTIAEN